ncbi:hypothetical protein [Streptomyces mirabilis]
MAEQLGELMGKHAGFGVVFVHGFKSSPAMWDAFGRLMASDTDLEAMTPMRFQYATRLVQPCPLRRIPTFDTVADSLKEFMDTEAQGFRRLALVAHSQGGLVVQRFLARMLTEGRGEELKRIRRVVLFACPNNGSQLGLTLRRWTLRANPQERQLRPLDEQITDTQRTVLRDIVNADVATERTCPIPFSVYAGETDNVVTPASARGAFPDAGVLPGDHFTIVRPDTTRHRSYTTLKRLLLAAADTDPPTDIPRSQTISVASRSGALSVAECAPERLGIHPAITGDARELEGTGHYVLPAFVARPHDHVTRQHFTEIAAGAGVELVLLRGGSCTGKTRTAYEAVKDQLTDWQLLQPRTRPDLITLLEKHHLPPRTVLWLDDVHQFLEGAEGETVAAGLHGLLDSRGPVVILATIWPGPHRSLTDTPPATRPDPHRQARTLLRRARLIQVPDTFTGLALTKLRQEALTDASLAKALATAYEPGSICQTLAAGPDLLDHWRNATNVYGKALITAAIDARRLGHGLPLSAALLRDATPGYLSPTQRAHADDDWFEQAIAYALHPVMQVTSALKLIPSPSGMGAVPDVYDLADYLEQTVERNRFLVPTSFWDSAVAHETGPQALRALAENAKDRALYQHAALLLHSSVQKPGDFDDHVVLGGLLHDLGMRDQAVRYTAAAATAGKVDGMVATALMAQESGDVEAALHWQRQAWSAGNERAFFSVYWLLVESERWDEAEAWIRPKAGEWIDAARSLAQLLTTHGRQEEAEEILWPLARDDAYRCRRDLINLLYEAGKADRIHSLFAPLAAAGDDNAREWLDAVRTWDSPSQATSDSVSDAGRPSPNAYVAQRGMTFEWAHSKPDPRTEAMAEAARAEAAGNLDEAVGALRAALPTQHWPLLQHLSGLLERQDQDEDALGVWRDLVEAGNPAALTESVHILERAGRGDEAETLIRRELLRGRSDADSWTTEPPALALLAERLTTTGRQEEAQLLQTYGLRPDGTTAASWQLPTWPAP